MYYIVEFIFNKSKLRFQKFYWMTNLEKEKAQHLKISAERMEPKNLNVYSKYLKFDIIVPSYYANQVLENAPVWFKTQNKKSKSISPDIDNKVFRNGELIFTYFVSLVFFKFQLYKSSKNIGVSHISRKLTSEWKSYHVELNLTTGQTIKSNVFYLISKPPNYYKKESNLPTIKKDPLLCFQYETIVHNTKDNLPSYEDLYRFLKDMNQSPKLNPFYNMEDLFTPKEIIELKPVINTNEKRKSNTEDEWKKYLLNDLETISFSPVVRETKETFKPQNQMILDDLFSCDDFVATNFNNVGNQQLFSKKEMLNSNESELDPFTDQIYKNTKSSDSKTTQVSLDFQEKSHNSIRNRSASPQINQTQSNIIDNPNFHRQKDSKLSSLKKDQHKAQKEEEKKTKEKKKKLEKESSAPPSFLQSIGVYFFGNSKQYEPVKIQDVKEQESFEDESDELVLESKSFKLEKSLGDDENESEESENEDEEEMINSFSFLSVGNDKKFVFGKLQNHLLDVVIITKQ